MNKLKKKFDCIEFKRAAQARITEVSKNSTPEEIRIRNEEEIARAEHPFAKWWRNLSKREVESK
ncbi:MAG: hypothetical protein SGI88_03195 [Candidatus Hydrogenedentes bacterium]|nr:hypothetical protein [Candidatus Hydrogenedentota bacterium]